VLAAAFAWTIVAGPGSVRLPHFAWVLSVLRLSILVAVCWCIIELALAKWVLVGTDARCSQEGES
jgi:hypothetical protein